MCESGCRPVVSTSSTRPDTVIRLGTGGQAATQAATPSQVPAVPLGNTECPCPVPCQHTPGLSPAFCFTEKYCGKYQHMCACQLLCLCSSLSVCPASITYLSIICHLLSSTVIYLLFPVICHSPIAYYLSTLPSLPVYYVISVVYQLWFIHRVLTVYPLTLPVTRPPVHFTVYLSLSFICHLFVFCYPLSIHPSILKYLSRM